MTAAGYRAMWRETMEDESINDIVSFNGSGKEPSGETAKAEAATPAVERNESGQFKSKEQTEDKAEVPAKAEAEAKPEVDAKVETKPEPKAEKPTGQLAALLAERAKRQELEARLAKLEQGNTEKPDFFTDPEKAARDLVQKEIAPLKQRYFQRSITDAQKAHGEDFEAAAENFSQLIEANPVLREQWLKEDDPGEFIYLVGSNTPEFRQAREAKTQETLTAKDAQIATLTAEIEAMKKAQGARDSVPESLNRQPSGSVPARQDDDDISSIVRFKTG
jgi:hypothetical protein